MNVRPDMIRSQGMPHLTGPQSTMLSMNTPHFLQQQQQQPQPGQQPQPQPPHMSLLQNGQNPNQSMNMLGGQPNAAGGPNSNWAMQMNAVRRHQAQAAVMQAHAQGAQGLSQVNAGPSHINGIGHNQMQGLGFSNQLMQHSQLRRAPSQPQLNQAAPHISGVNSGPATAGGMAGLGVIGMNPQAGMPTQLRQSQQQQQQMSMHLRQQHQQQQSMHIQGQGPMTSDMSIGLNRPAHLQSNGAMQPHVVRSSSAQAQLMGSLPQPSHPQSHPGNMQQSIHQQPFQNPMTLPHQHSQSQLGSSPHIQHNHVPGNLTGNIPPPANAVPPQSQVNRRLTPDTALFMNFQNPQISQNLAQSQTRMQSSNGQFPFVPSSSPPTQLPDLSQSVPTGPMSAPGSAGRSGIMPTPAQAFEQMSSDGFSVPFNIPPQSSVPPRPPSQHAPHPSFPIPPSQAQSQQQQHPQSVIVHQSPRQRTRLNTPVQTQRPPSQPQAPPGQSPQQIGLSRTPRATHPGLPANAGLLPPGRGPTAGQSQVGVPSASAAPPAPPTVQAVQITPRAPPAPPTVSHPTSSIVAGPPPPPDGTNTSQSQHAQPPPSLIPPRPIPNMTYPLGFGQGLMRLLQFSGVLASDSKTRLQLPYWENLIKEYFTPRAILKFTLWKDNQRNEAKPFEIGVPILPRFFLVTSQSGVKSMSLSLDGARERIMGQGHAVVECVHAVWTYRYTNGYTVTLRGPMTAHVLVSPNVVPNQPSAQHVPYTLKFDQLQFDANYHDKLIALESISGVHLTDSPMTPRLRAPPTPIMNGIMNRSEEDDRRYEEPRMVMERVTIPAEPVNAFGIPQATMRCLELAESVAQMSDLIQFSNEKNLGPLDALTQFAQKLRESQGNSFNDGGSGHHGIGIIGSGGGSLASGNIGTFDGINGVVTSTPVTLYSSTPSNPSGSQASAEPATPSQSGSTTIDTSSKQGKGVPQSQSQPSGSTPNSGPTSASTPAATPTAAISTPSTTHSTLKRKANPSVDNASPTVGSDQAPPAKRVNRPKRGRTQGG